MAALVLGCGPRWAPFSSQPATQRAQQRRRVPTRAQSGDDDRQQGEPARQEPAAPPAAAPPAAQAPPPPLANPAAALGGQLPSTRRLVVGTASATAIALGSNFLGVTSWLLGRDGGRLAEQLRLDVLVPVNGYRRCLDAENGYTFLYPARWLADQTLYRRYAERVEREAALDPPSLARARARRRGGVPEPSAAYGPPGGSGEENISVVVAPIREGFSLERMGTPEEAAAMFLQTTVAPVGSGRTAALLGAGARRDAAGQLYYWQEFTVQSDRFYRHNLSVYAARNGLLYTLNCQAAEARWADNEAGFRRAANTFAILNSGAATAGFPDRL